MLIALDKHAAIINSFRPSLRLQIFPEQAIDHSPVRRGLRPAWTVARSLTCSSKATSMPPRTGLAGGSGHRTTYPSPISRLRPATPVCCQPASGIARHVIQTQA